MTPSDVLTAAVVIVALLIWGVWRLSHSASTAAARRHERYQRRFNEAKTPVDQLRHARAYLDEVAGASDAKTAAVAKELFALAAKHNGAGAPAGPPQVVSRKPA